MVLCYNETERSHGGTGFFVSNKSMFKQQPNLVINESEKLESTFINWFFQIRGMLSKDVFISILV